RGGTGERIPRESGRMRPSAPRAQGRAALPSRWVRGGRDAQPGEKATSTSYPEPVRSSTESRMDAPPEAFEIVSPGRNGASNRFPKAVLRLTTRGITTTGDFPVSSAASTV